jgi:hypothetical protein
MLVKVVAMSTACVTKAVATATLASLEVTVPLRLHVPATVVMMNKACATTDAVSAPQAFRAMIALSLFSALLVASISLSCYPSLGTYMCDLLTFLPSVCAVTAEAATGVSVCVTHYSLERSVR